MKQILIEYVGRMTEEKIGFKLYTVLLLTSLTETMDYYTTLSPKHRYVSFTIEYDFKDVTSRNQEVLYKS